MYEPNWISYGTRILMRFPFKKYLNFFFRVYDPRAVTAFIGDPIEPKSTKPSNEVEFSEDDKLKVQELRDWWKQKAKTVPGTVDSNGFSQELTQDLSKLTVDTQNFNFVCKVVKVAGKGCQVSKRIFNFVPFLKKGAKFCPSTFLLEY